MFSDIDELAAVEFEEDEFYAAEGAQGEAGDTAAFQVVVVFAELEEEGPV